MPKNSPEERVTKGEPELQRETLSVMFTDIVGSTAYFERYGDTAGVKMVHQHAGLATEIIAGLGGKVIKTIGDSVMATFTDPAKAVQSAIEIQRRQTTENQELPGADRVQVRIGINHGSTYEVAGDVFGDAVNVAARVNSESGPAQVLITRGLLDALGADQTVRFRPLGKVSVKGRAEPVEMLEVFWTDEPAYDKMRTQITHDVKQGDLQVHRSVWAGLAEAGAEAGKRSAGKTLPSRLGVYDILESLGEGGMGAVYKARDTRLDRIVALKVIKPELAQDPEVLKRFRRELVLARQVTHKNVVRIFDLGEADGIQFISMEYIDGRGLNDVLQHQKKLPVVRSLDIIRDVCRGLHAAHQEGVVHRDLKPHNIMLNKDGRALVMDFGIARSADETRLTQTGTLLGTFSYMSPEQARGDRADHRSDIFSLGIILYEMLTGVLPFEAETPYGSLMKRLEHRPPPPHELDAEIPQEVSDVVMRCLAVNPEARFQQVTEILGALEGRGSARAEVAARPWWTNRAAMAAGAATAVVLAVVWSLIPPPPPVEAPDPITVLVADFVNETGDPLLDGTLEPMFDLALEGASFINSYRRDRARKAAADVQEGADRVFGDLARLVARREGINIVVDGTITLTNDSYTLTVEALDPHSDKLLVSLDADAAQKGEILGVVGTLSAGVRDALGDTTPESVQLAAAETFTVASLEAAHEYAQAQELQWEGQFEDAIAHYSRAVELDPEFGRAYAGLAASSFNLGRREEAEQFYKQAMARIDRMTEREKFRTRGGYYLLTGDGDKALEEMSTLVDRFPADSAGTANLALAHFYNRGMAKAQEYGRLSVAISPSNVIQRNNLALYALYAGDFAAAEEEARAVLELNPAYAPAITVLALSALGEGRKEDAVAEYQRLAAISDFGASIAADGLADLALLEGRAADAAANLREAISNVPTGAKDYSTARKYLTLAEAQLLVGDGPAARSSIGTALREHRDDSFLYRAARLYIRLGSPDEAQKLAAELGSSLSGTAQTYGKVVEGALALEDDNPQKAVRLLQEAKRIADTWFGRLELGRAYLEAGAFTEAHSEFELCLKRRGEATSVFLNDVPGYRRLPPVYYWLGRAQEGLGSRGAADSYRTFLGFLAPNANNGESGKGNPLVADARRRLESL